MACRTETSKIGEHEYSVTQWNAEKAILNKMRLIKFFGPSVTAIATGSLKDASKGDEIDALAKGVGLLFENNEPAEVMAFLKECVVGVARGDTKITNASFNELFSGDDLMDVYKVFVFVLKVNYSNLLGGQLAKSLLAKAKKLS